MYSSPPARCVSPANRWRSRSLGPRPVRGLDAPIEVYELVGATPLRSIARVAAVHRSSRFVARAQELEQLQQALERARGRNMGARSGIVGEAGVGKSRLTYEFISAQPCPVLGSCALSYENAASWAPVIDLLRSYFDLNGRQTPEEIASIVGAKMRGLDRKLEGDIAPILSLLDALPEDDPFRSLDARDRKQRVLTAQTRLILAQSQRDPLVLVFENLQWIDEESRAFLDALMAQLPRSRLLLLMNYRPEFEHDWQGREGFTQILLEPLPPPAARELLSTLFGDDRSLAGVQDMLIERSNGNPFFLEEIVSTLAETKAIVGEPGRWRLAAKADALDVPPTVQAVIAARIDRLPPDEKLLLQQASVIGIDVPLALLEAVTEVPDELARRALRSLQTSSFIHQTNLFPDLEYRFRHVLTRDVAYSSLLKDQRRGLHAQAVLAIERLYSDRLPSYLDELANHAVRGELWDKAVTYNRQLGVRAQERASNPEAVSSFEDALSALAHLPPSRETLELEIDLRSAMRPALLQLGRLDEVHTISRQVEQLALELGDQQRLAQAYSYLINYHYLKGETRTDDRLRRALHHHRRSLRRHKRYKPSRASTWGRATTRAANTAKAERELERNIGTSIPSAGDHAVRLLLRVACLQPCRARRIRRCSRLRARCTRSCRRQRSRLQPDDRSYVRRARRRTPRRSGARGAAVAAWLRDLL